MIEMEIGPIAFDNTILSKAGRCIVFEVLHLLTLYYRLVYLFV